MLKPSDLLLRRKAGDLSVTDQQIADCAKAYLALEGSPVEDVVFLKADPTHGRPFNEFRLLFLNGAWSTAKFVIR